MAQQQPRSPPPPEDIPVAQEYQPPPQWGADANGQPPMAAPYYYPPAVGAPVSGEKLGMPYGGGYAPPVAAPVQDDAPVCCGLRKKSAILLALVAALVVILGAAGIGVGVALSGGDDSKDTKSAGGTQQPVVGVNLPQAPLTAPPRSDNFALPPTAVITPGGNDTLITPTPMTTTRLGTTPPASTPRSPPPSAAADGPSSGLNRADMLILAVNAKRSPGDALTASGSPGLGCVADEISSKLADQYEPSAANPCQFGSNTYVANTFRDALTMCGINDPKAQSHDAIFACKVPGATAQDVVDSWASAALFLTRRISMWGHL